MFQPLIEKILIFNIGEKISIDNKEFYLKRIEAQWEEDYDDFSLILWGKEPHATTLHHSRIIKFDEYVWRPSKFNCSFETLDGKRFVNDSFNLERLQYFINNQFTSKEDEIISCTVEVSTMINTARGYFW